MKAAAFQRTIFGMRLWATVLVLAVALGDDLLGGGPCPHCSQQGGVEVSLDSELSLGADGTILSEVLVEPPTGSCPDCAATMPYFDHQPVAAFACDGCDAGSAPSSVGEELARRRQRYRTYCDGLHSRLQFRVGAVYMDRVTENFRVLIESTSNPIRQLNAEDFDFEWEPGLDVSLSQLAWDNSAFEFRFLGLREFNATQRVDTEGSEVRINADPVVFAPDVQSIHARYSSDLYGFELNWHYVTYCPFNYIAGFRYVALDDDLSTVLDADPQSLFYRTKTRNDLYGLQIGITSVPDMPLFGWHCLSWYGKAGIFGNDARQQTVLDTSLLGQIVSESPDTSAVVWEFGLGLDLPISDCVSIQGGYSAMILERVTVASDQLSSIDFLNASGSHNRGTAMFHGGTVAMVFRF